jgi:primosomal protein N'
MTSPVCRRRARALPLDRRLLPDAARCRAARLRARRAVRHGRTDPPVRTRRVLRITRELPSLTMRDEACSAAHRVSANATRPRVDGRSRRRRSSDHGAEVLRAVMKALVDKGVAEIGEERSTGIRSRHRARTAGASPADPAQRRRSRRCHRGRAAVAGSGHAPFLLYGVTGSGKTLVYIELLREIVSGRARRDRARAGDRVHAADRGAVPCRVRRHRRRAAFRALSDGERYDAWRALREGARRIAIGARSAIFAPVQNLGAIIVDEEHEASYKQSEAPRYHAREVAVVRARPECASVCSAVRHRRSRAGTTRSAASTAAAPARARRGTAAAARAGRRSAPERKAEAASDRAVARSSWRKRSSTR